MTNARVSWSTGRPNAYDLFVLPGEQCMQRFFSFVFFFNQSIMQYGWYLLHNSKSALCSICPFVVVMQI